jgi:hypothetical protein
MIKQTSWLKLFLFTGSFLLMHGCDSRESDNRLNGEWHPNVPLTLESAKPLLQRLPENKAAELRDQIGDHILKFESKSVKIIDVKSSDSRIIAESDYRVIKSVPKYVVIELLDVPPTFRTPQIIINFSTPNRIWTETVKGIRETYDRARE